MEDWSLVCAFACFCIPPLLRYSMVQVKNIAACDLMPGLYNDLNT